jgi:hypothetical protein
MAPPPLPVLEGPVRARPMCGPKERAPPWTQAALAGNAPALPPLPPNEDQVLVVCAADEHPPSTLVSFNEVRVTCTDLSIIVSNFSVVRLLSAAE